MSALRATYEPALAQFPGAEQEQRRAHLERFLAAGFPTKRLEDWRYTDLAPLHDQAFAPASDAAAIPDLAPHLLAGCDRVVFVNGRLRAGLGHGDTPEADTPAVPHQDGAIVALNRALATGGLSLTVPAGRQRERPLQVLLVTVPGGAADMSHCAHAIHVEPGAGATVILQHVGASAGSHLTTHTLDVHVADGARLDLVRLQDEGAGTTHLLRVDARIGRDAQLHATTVDLGGGLVRSDWNVRLVAPGAQVALDGLYAPAGTTHVDNHTRIDHESPHGTSRERFRGVVTDRARAVFNGKIVVHPGAQKTDSEQRVANLLLSKTAEVNAKPELEIYADDVKCAHGATFGQLDESAAFYLRSRGIPADMARALLTYTFAYEVLGSIAHAGARRLAERRFLDRLPQGLDLEGLL